MPSDFGWFRRGGEVRRATSPTHAVKLRSQGWTREDGPAETVAVVEPDAVVAPEGASLDLDDMEPTQ